MFRTSNCINDIRTNCSPIITRLLGFEVSNPIIRNPSRRHSNDHEKFQNLIQIYTSILFYIFLNFDIIMVMESKDCTLKRKLSLTILLLQKLFIAGLTGSLASSEPPPPELENAGRAVKRPPMSAPRVGTLLLTLTSARRVTRVRHHARRMTTYTPYNLAAEC